jgi:hypothetical protein
MQGPNNPKFIPVSGNLGNTNEMIDLDDIFDGKNNIITETISH